MIDLLLPATDAGALAQAVGAAILYGAAFVVARHDRELLLFVTGLAFVTFAWFGIRTLH
jgi:hypothetical protein